MLAVRDLHLRFGGIEALRGVSIEAGPGRIVAVLGRNGAGKSTLLRAISGLARPWRGTITWNDRLIGRAAPAAITRMGIVHVPEGRRILAELTVRENLLLGSYGHRRGRDGRLARTLELFPVLEERLDASGAALSGGQQQMLAISRGLMASPQLLMVDELSLGLAPIAVEELARRLERLRAEGLGILLVEQEYPLALRLADYVYVLQKGRVRWEGPGPPRGRGRATRPAATAPGRPISGIPCGSRSAPPSTPPADGSASCPSPGGPGPTRASESSPTATSPPPPRR